METCGGEFDRNGVVVANGGKDNLRDVAKGAHLGPIQRQACVALVPVGFQMSRQALWLYHHATLKQRLFVPGKNLASCAENVKTCVLIRRRCRPRRPFVSLRGDLMTVE